MVKNGRIRAITIMRVIRTVRGGGFGDIHKHGYAFCLVVQGGSTQYCLVSFRGRRREWSSLDRLDKWLCAHGIHGGWSLTEQTAITPPI
jgi:hypothetical protein